jgi:cytochrome c553
MPAIPNTLPSILTSAIVYAVVGLGFSGQAVQAFRSDDADGVRFFREKIQPVLATTCYRCHSAELDKPKAGLRLDSRASVLKGGDSGPAIVPGQSGDSLLILAIRHEDGLAMPPKEARLSDAVIADFVQWIDHGASMPAEEANLTSGIPADETARRHWAFQPVRRPNSLPRVVDEASGGVIDAFIREELSERGWPPAPEASRADWIRRVTFDLIGLPPTPEEIDIFLDDNSATAFERVVDRLLASPHYGERWAQHWLDVVRYAESEGFEYDRHIPGAWRYRDYVIDSLNEDKPFDRFLVEQVAGDEIAPDDPECRSAAIFHRLGPVRRNMGDSEIAFSRNEVLTERTDIFGTAFLGLTIGCARCHNHKLEPISQKDYYRLQAYMAATDEHDIALVPDAERIAWEAKMRDIKDQMKRVQELARAADGAEKERLSDQLEALEDRLPTPLPTIPSISNVPERRTKIHVLRRGVWENKGESVGPRPPDVLVPTELPELPADDPNPRTHLARWLADPTQPLTPRVIVNRLWQHHFGAGLVKTPNDFGLKGSPPSHPELLDWLAATFVEGGWRLKPIHRQIALSATYRQSNRSPIADQASVADPDNRLLWRFPRRRLSAEEIRDAMLTVSGRLTRRTGGASVMVPVDAELVRLLYKPSQWQVASDAAEYDRRSIYLIAKRNLRHPFLEVFDGPALTTSCPRRESSTHAPQALELLNGRLSNDLATAFSQRLAEESGDDPDGVVDRAFRLALGRPPTAEERALSIAFLREHPVQELAVAIFNLNGFLYVP